MRKSLRVFVALLSVLFVIKGLILITIFYTKENIEESFKDSPLMIHTFETTYEVDVIRYTITDQAADSITQYSTLRELVLQVSNLTANSIETNISKTKKENIYFETAYYAYVVNLEDLLISGAHKFNSDHNIEARYATFQMLQDDIYFHTSQEADYINEIIH